MGRLTELGLAYLAAGALVAFLDVSGTAIMVAGIAAILPEVVER